MKDKNNTAISKLENSFYLFIKIWPSKAPNTDHQNHIKGIGKDGQDHYNSILNFKNCPNGAQSKDYIHY